MVDAFRFFRVVPPVPSMMVTGFVAVTLVSTVAVAIDPGYTRGTLTAVFVLQAFACSSGFAGHARRGHYDLLLTRGERRSVVAAVHWLMSGLPGLVSWIVISTAEAVATKVNGVGFASGTALGIVIVSAVAWTSTAPLPRFSGAIAWVVVIVIGGALVPKSGLPATTVAIFYPPALIGANVARDPIAAGAALSAALASVAITLVWVERSDLRLESAQ